MSDALLALVLLACPLSMGLMMWLMMRNHGGHQEPHGGPSATDAEVARLRAEVDQLRAERRTDHAEPPRSANPS